MRTPRRYITTNDLNPASVMMSPTIVRLLEWQILLIQASPAFRRKPEALLTTLSLIS